MDSMECPRFSHLLVSLQNVATDSDSTFSYKLFNLKNKKALPHSGLSCFAPDISLKLGLQAPHQRLQLG